MGTLSLLRADGRVCKVLSRAMRQNATYSAEQVSVMTVFYINGISAFL